MGKNEAKVCNVRTQLHSKERKAKFHGFITGWGNKGRAQVWSSSGLSS